MWHSTVSPDAYTYVANPGYLAVMILAVIIPGSVILACIVTSIFLCWNRDRIPIFRSKAQKFSRPGAKTRVPYGGKAGSAYPTQAVQLETTQQETMRAEEEGTAKSEEEDEPSKPAGHGDVIVAVDVNESSKL